MTVAQMTDVYELLGISPDASVALAREMYWQKVQPFLDREADAASDRDTIDALNHALAIVLDDRLRSVYDSERRDRTRSAAGQAGQARAPKPAGRRVLWWGVLIVAVAGSTYVAPQFAVAAAVLGALALSLAIVRRDGGRASATFETLHLRDDATQQQIEVAYRIRAQALLLRVRRDPNVIPELDRLDRAYVAAMTSALRPQRREAAEGAEAQPASVAQRIAAGMAEALMSMVRATPAALEAGGRLAVRGASTLRGVLATRAVSESARDLDMGAADEQPYIDVQRRLTAGLKDSAVHIARTARRDSALEPPDAVAGPTAFLLLESAAGTRRVGIGERPVSIGSGGKCDLVLPERDDIAPEHALVWRHGTQIVLHAALDVTCHVNDRAVTWALLDEGDVVRVGDHVLKVSLAT